MTRPRLANGFTPFLVAYGLTCPASEECSTTVERNSRIVHVMVSLALLVVTLLAAGRGQELDGRRDAIVLGCLAIVMILATPINHPHYLAMAPLLVSPLLHGTSPVDVEGLLRGSLGRILLLLNLAYVLNELPILDGVATRACLLGITLALWVVGIHALRDDHDGSSPLAAFGNSGASVEGV